MPQICDNTDLPTPLLGPYTKGKYLSFLFKMLRGFLKSKMNWKTNSGEVGGEERERELKDILMLKYYVKSI